MRSWKRYQKYKDSGLEWLGEIPEEWKVMRIASFSSKITNGYVGPTREILVECGVKYIQSLYIKNNKIVFDNKYFVSEEWSKQHNNSILHEDDVLVVQTGDIGQVAVVPEEFTGANCHALIIIQTIKNHILGRYLSLILNSDYGYHSLKSIQTGALHPHLNCTFVREINIPTPPLPEQTAIASFLDRETTRIDALIEKKQRQIELLQEKRAALISQMALRGSIRETIRIDSQKPVLQRLSKISIIIDCLHQTPDYIDDGIPMVRISDINNNELDISNTKTVDISTYNEFSKKYQPKKNDILISRVGSIGSISLVKENQIFCLGQNCAVIRPLINPLYLFHVLRSDFIKEQIQLALVGSTLKTLSLEDIKGLRIPIWNQEILEDIIDAFLIENKRIENLIIKISESIKYLHEYRSALISAAVTGKIDVRDEVTA